jgi:Tfp pilus assembly protein PilO
MAKTKAAIETKRIAIDKASAQMVAVVAVAAFVTIFCLVAARAVWSQNRYQARVTSAKEKAYAQLQKNLRSFDSLVSAYKGFDAASTNVIGGLKAGTGDNDGSNSKIILDALPPAYDFPALTSSIEKILADRGLKVSSITGTDDLSQQSNTSSPDPQAVSIPFSFSVKNGSYQSVQQLTTALENSIRPFQIDIINLSGGANDMTVTINAHTYYQPAKSVSITKKVIK